MVVSRRSRSTWPSPTAIAEVPRAEVGAPRPSGARGDRARLRAQYPGYDIAKSDYASSSLKLRRLHRGRAWHSRQRLTPRCIPSCSSAARRSGARIPGSTTVYDRQRGSRGGIAPQLAVQLAPVHVNALHPGYRRRLARMVRAASPSTVSSREHRFVASPRWTRSPMRRSLPAARRSRKRSEPRS